MDKQSGIVRKTWCPVCKSLFPTCVLIVYFFVLLNIQIVMSRSVVGNGFNSVDSHSSGKNSSDKGHYDLEKVGGKYESEEEHAYRHKRQLNFEMTLEEGQLSTLCSYDVKVDTNPNRTPEKITRVECKNQGCVCSQIGNYKCTQLISQIHVQYREVGENSEEIRRYDVIKVPYACVCALRLSVGFKTIPPPDLV